MHYAPHLLSHVPDLVAHGGYSLLGLSIILEALPLIGSLIPGHVIIVSAGFFAKLGVLRLDVVLLVSILSAMFGDLLGFMIGRKWGDAFLYKFGKRLSLKEEYIDKTKKLIDEHTGKTIIFGKFSPITRPFIAFLVGSSRVQTAKFWLYNTLGSIAWAGLSVMIGYIFGASYPVFSHYLGKFIFLALVGSILIIWGYRVVNSRFHIFKKYELFMLGLNLLSLWVLLKTIQDSIARSAHFVNFDIYTNIFISDYARPWMITAAHWIGAIGDTEAFFALGLVLGFAFLMKNKWRRAAVVLLSVTSTSIVVQWAKVFFMRDRPLNALEFVTSGSFPSGHASLSAAFFLACVYIFAPKIRSWVWRELFIVACVIIVIVIGISRVVLNVHWASDVVAGWALGIFMATGSVLVVKYAAAILLRDNK